MKREADNEMGSPQKRTRRGDEQLCLLIPSKAAGAIIGKGGETITKLRSQYKASITIPDCLGPERVLTLSSDLETICNIVKDLVPRLTTNGAANHQQNDFELRMLIHQSQAGCVIGRGGCKVKEVREKTGAQVKIYSKCAPQSTERIIQIIGDPDKCIDAVREVISLIKGNPIKGPNNPYDPHNFDDFYAHEYGGYGNNNNDGDRKQQRFPPRGPPNAYPPRNGGPMGGHNGDAYDRNGGGMGGGYNNGPPPHMNGDGGWNNDNNWNSRPSMNGGGGGGGAGNMNRHSNGNMNHHHNNHHHSNNSSEDRSSTQVSIPKHLAGAIIGKGGNRIRQIRLDSSAAITIDEPLAGSDERIITITGTPAQIHMAQYLLQQSVMNNADQNGY